jgi:hypothetical protein
VDRRQVARGRESLALELGDHALAVGAARERDDVDEPRADVIGVVGERDLEPRRRREQLAVASAAAWRSERIRSSFSSWPIPSAARTVVDAVVEAEARVVEPAAAVGSAPGCEG